MNKAEKYQAVIKQINSLPEISMKERLQKIAQLLQESFGFWWTGFYFVETMPWIEEVRCDGKEEALSGKEPWIEEVRCTGKEEAPGGKGPWIEEVRCTGKEEVPGGKEPWIEEVRCTGKEEAPGGKGPWLILGPNVGPPACERIGFGRGVCGTAWAERRTVIVADVDEFPGHIACSSESRSEIVVPIFIDNKVAGVLDIDSRELAAFDEIDAEWLQQIVGGIR
jgi:putative methionine-R-sulfoxide reductase with GAF domain